MRALIFLAAICSGIVRAADSIELHAGFVTKVRCEGRLLLSAIGNDGLVRLQALPRELGCGVLLKPLAAKGVTNLILETSSGTIQKRVVLMGPGVEAASYSFKGVSR